MKLYITISCLLVATIFATDAAANPKIRNTNARAAAQNNSDFYIGAKGLWNFVNHGFYATIPTIDTYSEKVDDASVKFAPQYGFELNVGTYITKNFRAGIDAGLLGKHDAEFISGTGLRFFESAYYATLNGIYSTDQTNYGAVYFGGGAGAVMANTGIEDFSGSTDKNSEITPMGVVMLGWEKDMGGDLVFDAGVKAAIWHGREQTYDDFALATGVEKLGTGLVWNLAFMMGVRYNF